MKASKIFNLRTLNRHKSQFLRLKLSPNNQQRARPNKMPKLTARVRIKTNRPKKARQRKTSLAESTVNWLS